MVQQNNAILTKNRKYSIINNEEWGESDVVF